MSRWADAFTALSGGSDTFDTIRHSDDPPAKVSQSVNSVTVAARGKPPMPGTDCTAESWVEVKTERAAVAEHDGNLPRHWVAGFVRLDPETPPADVPPQRWLSFIDDCGRVLDGSFAAKAAGLGEPSMSLAATATLLRLQTERNQVGRSELAVPK
jgi:hypothetical protein